MLGIGSFVLILLLSKSLHLDTVSWILDKGLLLGPVAVVILFLPELRQTLESFGKFWPQNLVHSRAQMEAATVEELVAAVTEMATDHVGALIVIEREASLDSIVANGVLLDAHLSSPLIQSIFYEGNPLHDGAVILRNSSIVAAACRLPLSESSKIDSHVHMRHRAGVGITEVLDCFVIIVSEERGHISVASGGELKRLKGTQELRDVLNHELRGDEEKPRRLLTRSRTKGSAAKEDLLVDESAPAASPTEGVPGKAESL